MHTPTEISMTEWAEIMKVPDVQNMFGIRFGDAVEGFASKMYGAKYLFASGGRVVTGDMYVVYCDAPVGRAVCLVRKSTGLEVLR